MKIRAVIIALLALGLGVMPALFLDRAGAQGEDIPGFPTIYSGSVSAGGGPAPDGLRITARVGDREFGPVETRDGRYRNLGVSGSRADDGETVTFWLQGVTRADQEATFTYRSSPGVTQRTLNLSFPRVPEPTPTPTATPTATPIPTTDPLKLGLQTTAQGPLSLGDEVVVNVVAAPQGHRFLRGEVWLTYDSRVLRPVSGEMGALMPDADHLLRVEGSRVKLTFFQVNPTPRLAVEAPLAIVRFKVRNDAPAGETEVSFLQGGVVNGASQTLDLQTGTTSLVFGVEGTPGDINHDGTVDILDLALLGHAFDTREGERRFNAGADLNDSGRVDSADVQILAIRYGEGG